MINKIRDNKKEIIIFIIIFLISLINYAILDSYNGDVYWSYGWAYNIVNSLIPYKDFNMVQFPFASLFYAFIMKIFGDKLLIYIIINSFFISSVVMITRKFDINLTLIILFFLLLFPITNYNLLCVFLFFVLIIFEKENQNSYLIGIILSLLVLTNQKMAVLLIPTLLNRNLKENIKLLKAFVIPAELLVIYLCINNAFNDFVYYAVLGLFDFGSGNLNISFLFVLIELLIIFYLLINYIRTKNIYILYCLFFQIITLPIIDYYHVILGIVPFTMCLYSKTGKTFKKINFIFIIFIILVFISKLYNNIINTNGAYLNIDLNSNMFLVVSNKDMDEGISSYLYKYYYDNIDEYDIYFIWDNSYYAKLYMKEKINKFDFILIGNNGYKGNENLENKIKSMNNVLFIVYEIEDSGYTYDQTNYELVDFIKSNYEEIEYLGGNFYVYKIVND